MKPNEKPTGKRTAALVPYADLINFVYLTRRMRTLQRQAFDAKKRLGVMPAELVHAAKREETRVDEALNKIITAAETTPSLFASKEGGAA